MVLTTFKFDAKTAEAIKHLKEHYGATSIAEVFRKALALLDLSAEIEEQHGQLIAKRGDQEQVIVIR